MTPPAWSSFPEIGLNLTSTKPSLRFVSSLRQIGKVAWPDCFRTFGLLGAVSSFSTVHFSWPVPVLVAVHPGGGAPVLRLSKFTVSASAKLVTIVIASIITFIIEDLPSLRGLLAGERGTSNLCRVRFPRQSSPDPFQRSIAQWTSPSRLHPVLANAPCRPSKSDQRCAEGLISKFQCPCPIPKR